MVAGFFFGLAFGVAGIGAAFLAGSRTGQFRLGHWWKLKMHPPQRTAWGLVKATFASATPIQTAFNEFPLAEHTREEAAAVFQPIEIDYERALQLRLGEDHGRTLDLPYLNDAATVVH